MAKKPTYEELQAKIDFYEDAINESRKQARAALSQYGIWHQDFHGAELTAITATFLATRETLDAKEKALSEALKFIGKFEGDQLVGLECYKTLEKINQLIAGESIQESIKKQGGN